MLVLSRKVGETILIGDNIEVSIERLEGNRVSIGIKAPAEVKITRAELLERLGRVGGTRTKAD